MSKYSGLFDSVEESKQERDRGKFDPSLGLSIDQFKAYNSPINESALTFAGAGSGKTKLLVERVSKLIKYGVDPKSIAIITYTKNSADEVKHRIISKTSAGAINGLFIGTLHSLILKLMLRKKSFKFELSSPDAILDYLKQFREDLPDQYSDFSDSELITLFNKKREQLDSDMTVLGNYASQFSTEFKEKGLYDFTCLLEDALIKLTPSFSYIFVDEFQDISPLQYSVLKLLGKESCKYWLIGDPCQSIYAFRGASASIMASLKEEFPAYYLNTNYRSDKCIVEKSNHFLNSFSFFEKSDKVPFSEKEGSVSVLKFEDAKSELAAAIEWCAHKSSYVILGRTQKAIEPYINAGLSAKTVHDAKGLEWVSVWVVGCNQGSFPHVLSSIEEEACIFYVAMSRAKSELVMSYFKKPSKFIEIIQ